MEEILGKLRKICSKQCRQRNVRKHIRDLQDVLMASYVPFSDIVLLEMYYVEYIEI